MICFDTFPDSKVAKVDVHTGTYHTIMNIEFENGDRVNFFLSEGEMTTLLHKFDEAKERWLNEVPKLSN